MTSTNQLSNYINGQWFAGTGAVLQVVNPGDGALLWQGHDAGMSEVDRACRAARSAFNSWAMTSFEQRLAICSRFRDLLKQHAAELAGLIASEVGKPRWEALTEVSTMANKIDISAQSYQARTGTLSSQVADGDAVLRHRPHGVMAVFGPYNFPGHLPNGHIVPALLAGNTVVFKPSEFAPQTAMKTVELWIEAGLPVGVLNLVNGGKQTGMLLSAHAEIDGVLFTGSYQTGVILHRQFGGQPGKMLALEMGGNNALVVWDVANLDAAVHHTIFSAFVSAGQRCTCARRLIVPDNAFGQRFINRLVEVAAQLKVDRSDAEPAPFMGPVVSAEVAQRLLAAQAGLIAKGGKALLTMRHVQAGTGLLTAGIIDVTAASEVADEEWFGPLLQVIRVADFDAALQVANHTSFGLAAGLLSDDGALWQQFQRRIRAGVVNWNRPTTGAASTAPFGGIGNSGNHRPSAYYAADYCAYPVASIETGLLEMPKQLSPGLVF